MKDEQHAARAATNDGYAEPGAEVPGSAQSGVGPAGAVTLRGPGTGPIGRTIKGRYRIKRLLGEGGMGGVYEGEHLEIGRRVAIKIVHALHASDPNIAARMKQEARSTGSIESENIVQVLDAGDDEALGFFIVMELLKGEDLCALLLRKKRVSPMAAATLAMQAAQGLARAHAAGIIHRDLKPANVFVCTRDDGSSLVKLVDFGIAKLVRDMRQTQGGGMSGGGLTRLGTVIGTPQYMSPEQAQGLLTVDHRTDVYSLGAVLFEAIVGHPPFPELPTYEQTILQIVTQHAPRISQFVPGVHPELDRLCAEMMAHDPAQRPHDMSTVRERIVRIFPQIDGGRLPMRSLTNEMALEAMVPADQSGQVRALIDAGRVAVPASGVGIATERTRSSSPGSEREAVRAATMIDDEPLGDVAGVPRRRGGAWIALAGVLALALGAGGVALSKMRANASAPVPGQGAGLVQSTVAPSPPPVVAAPVAPPPSVAVAPAPAVQAPAPPLADAKSTPPKPAHVHHHGHARPKPAAPASAAGPAPAAAPAPAAPPEPEPDARPVGGTNAATEF